VPPHPKAAPVTIDLTGVTSTGDPKDGLALFNRNCLICHGANVSGRFLST
jgi:mono/diheme cytochrome c family protein